MQRTGLGSTRAQRGWIATVAVALVAAALLPPAQAAGTLERARQAGKLTLGYRGDARPFSYRDESGNAAGYSVELCKMIAEAVKAEARVAALAVEWVPVTIEGRFGDVQQGKVDLLCGADTVTLGRRREISFSIPVFPGGIGAMLRADSSFRLRQILTKGEAARVPLWRASPAQILVQQTFSVVTGTTSESWLQERRETLNIPARVAPVDAYEAGIQRLLERKSDVFFGDRAILLDAAKRSAAARDLIVLDRHFTHEPLALGLARGDDDFRLLVDRTLSRLFRSKEFVDLYGKWFGELDESALAFFRLSALPE
jgi:ABC-type amino acid transport substrate-binding protein